MIWKSYFFSLEVNKKQTGRTWSTSDGKGGWNFLKVLKLVHEGSRGGMLARLHSVSNEAKEGSFNGWHEAESQKGSIYLSSLNQTATELLFYWDNKPDLHGIKQLPSQILKLNQRPRACCCLSLLPLHLNSASSFLKHTVYCLPPHEVTINTTHEPAALSTLLSTQWHCLVFFSSLLVNLCFKWSWLGFCFININSTQSNFGFMLAQSVMDMAMFDSIYGKSLLGGGTHTTHYKVLNPTSMSNRKFIWVASYWTWDWKTKCLLLRNLTYSNFGHLLLHRTKGNMVTRPFPNYKSGCDLQFMWTTGMFVQNVWNKWSQETLRIYIFSPCGIYPQKSLSPRVGTGFSLVLKNMASMHSTTD